MHRSAAGLALILVLAALTGAAWWWPNRGVAGDVTMPGGKLNSVSFAPFRANHSPLVDRFPTAEQVEEDLALIAPRVRAIRTYASIEGAYEVAEIAARHGVKVWKGAWLGRDRIKNEAEIAKLITVANAHPEVVERVVVGNEVLLRRDLVPRELIAYLDQVRASVRQPVSYADVWEFWVQNPEIADHVDIITIHILPYWEDDPTGVDSAVAHLGEVYRHMRARFPGKPIAIGETGWPSRGRARQDATPGVAQQARFVREFVSLAATEGFDYNLIEAFDQVWKARNEGTVGANWGLWTADRAPKFPLDGPVVETPEWRGWAVASVAIGVALFAAVLLAWPELPGRARVILALIAMALGAALGFATETAWTTAYDIHLMLAGGFNVAAQAVLAWMVVNRAAMVLDAAATPRLVTLSETTLAIRELALRGDPPAPGSAQGHLVNIFLFTAALLMVLLVVDPRYRDFPTLTLGVPAIALAARIGLEGWPRASASREGALVAGALVFGAVWLLVREGPWNVQAVVWALLALWLAAVPARPWLLKSRRAHAHTPRQQAMVP